MIYYKTSQSGFIQSETLTIDSSNVGNGSIEFPNSAKFAFAGYQLNLLFISIIYPGVLDTNFYLTPTSLMQGASTSLSFAGFPSQFLLRSVGYQNLLSYNGYTTQGVQIVNDPDFFKSKFMFNWDTSNTIIDAADYLKITIVYTTIKY